MAFLGFGDYNKPGKGVSKDAPEKKGFFLYWDIVFHKFTKIFGANVLYTLTSVIWLAFLAVLCVPMLIGATTENVMEIFANSGQEVDLDNAAALLRILYVNGAFLIFNFLGSGPVSAAYAYTVRCFAHRQHVWIVSDGWKKIRENLKQSLVVLLINTVALFVGGTAIKFYYTLASSGQIVYALLLYVVVVISIIFIWMQFYIYQLMTYFSCTIKQLYKNALILALTKLPMNILLTIITAVVSVIPYMFTSSMMTTVLFSSIIGMLFTRFAVEFSASRTVGKLIAESAIKEENAREEEKTFDDDLAEKIKRDKE